MLIIMLLYLSANGISFTAPVDDPWYSAHNGPYNLSIGIDKSSTADVWYSDEPVSVLGCATQIQYCNPNLPSNSGCSELMSFANLCANWDNTNQTMWRSEEQAKMVYEFMSNVNNVLPMSALIESVGMAALTSRNTLSSGTQNALPDNQWQLDVENLVAIYMASVQRQFIEWANGPRFPGLAKYVSGPSDQWDTMYCHTQVCETRPQRSVVVDTHGIFLTNALENPKHELYFFLSPRPHTNHRHRRVFPRPILRTRASLVFGAPQVRLEELCIA